MKLLKRTLLLCLVSVIAIVSMTTNKVEASSIGFPYTENKGLGYTIDAVKKKDANLINIRTGNPVLREDFHQSLFNEGRVLYSNLGMDSTSETFSGLTYNEITKDVTASYSQSVSMPFTYEIFSGRVDAGMSQNLAVNYQQYTSQYYYMKSFEVMSYKLDLPNYNGNLSEYKSNLHPEFLSALNKLNTGSWSYDYFFYKYGTHFIGSAIFGGEADIYYTMATNEVVFDSDMETSFNAKVEAGITGLESTNASVSVSASMRTHSALKNRTIEESFSSKSRGGNAFDFVSEAGFTSSYSSWINSITQENSTLIKYGEEGLIPIWELIPLENYPNIEARIVNEFQRYANNYHNGIDTSYEFDQDKYFPDTYTPTEGYGSHYTGLGKKIRSTQDKVIDDGYDGFGNDYDTVDVCKYFNVNFRVMEYLGYTKVKIQLNFNAKEENAGYQYVYLYSTDDNNVNHQLYESKFEHGGGGFADKTWDNYTRSKTVNLFDLLNDDKFFIRWDASGTGEDTWYNDDLYVQLTFYR